MNTGVGRATCPAASRDAMARASADKPDTVGGWSFSAESSHISGNPGLLALSRELSDPYVPVVEAAVHPFCVHGSTRSLKPCMCGSALVMGVNMHLPEAVFGANHVTLKHLASGFTLRFDAADALRCWARDSIQHGSRDLRVPPAAAAAWRERMAVARQRSSVDVDWTFRCDSYGPDGTLPTDAALSTVALTSAKGCNAAGCQRATPPARTGAAPPVAGGTSLITLKPSTATSAKQDALPLRPPPVKWALHTGEGLAPTSAAGRLLRQQDPILWSCDLPIFFDLGRLEKLPVGAYP